MPSLGTNSTRPSASRIHTTDLEIIPLSKLCCAAMLGRSPARWSLTTLLVVVSALVPLHAALAFDRTNIPLKNWGGFSEYRDATYDDLERLVTAGLADRTLLNTKPLNRIEAARVVARAIERIRRDEPDDLNLRRDLEPVLDRLMEEFKVELASLGPDTRQRPGAEPVL